MARLVFDQIAGYHCLAKLTCNTNHYKEFGKIQDTSRNYVWGV